MTFISSRIGVGVTGGEPYGFDIGAEGNTKALKGMDLGVRGMQKGGLRKLIVPPELGYGSKGALPSWPVDCNVRRPGRVPAARICGPGALPRPHNDAASMPLRPITVCGRGWHGCEVWCIVVVRGW